MKIGHGLNDYAATQTTQAHSICIVERTGQPKLTEAEETIIDIHSVYESLNKLNDRLNRLAYVLQKKAKENP
jgi:hypothetical protein